ncbi:MAG: hypothetical protein FJ146_11850 [Deltaproteobacteria bacterium]|nr:hypothetical protein [Deltaproteobacteria bacterium]
MGTVINFTIYRKKARKQYMAKYGRRIERLVQNFIRHNVECDFQQLAEEYQAGQQDGDMVSWDYVQFRDIVAEALDQVYGAALYEQLKTQPWFDGTMIHKDELIDMCLTTFILGSCHSAAKT